MHGAFQLVDVFGTDEFSGNPLAVIEGGEPLDTERMQAITRWLNLSETAFLLPPTLDGADYGVRIFTPTHELPFAGHPTLGSCHAWLAAGHAPRHPGLIMQEYGVGLVPVRRREEMLFFASPALIRSDPVDESDLATLVGLLRIDRSEVMDAQWVDNGPGWVGVLLASGETVRRLEPVRQHSSWIDIGVVGPQEPGRDTAFELRAFCTDAHGMLIEDPVTGSLNASVAEWLFASRRATGAYVAAQGTCLDRTGCVHVERDETGQVWVGGRTRTLFSGERGPGSRVAAP